ncbi:MULTISPECIES: FAD-dependent 5-carboxymethylaminomethyl-2-thiouridine(34) oxidoreductase MnmC [unclassified Wenzhouxiangella]|uniref:FAD-dependent 5-carboxymethylaminomethyl-2-thiouridine(34) oxidoreductase MnmC n=1 Tax=unclassified Wenzhouxiangella TaxID=2613841 RepID=UPI000E3284DE|nr:MULTISPECIES: FAD-dependent 5-carboxymethylaminomethyl-2-thiouridine(34) oxidoreductase MnmC [unclassified Wenzhouxiangella]RFF27190.1 FAD-dependent oxidoreductase [Wenzhouxiangella sp. 15181]RFP69123.1 FAD-dependent oxidoreductase [Wenzhouxiangella sp. 15190]
MSDFTLSAIEPAQIDWQGDTPHASPYGDSYFMPGHGMAESRAVFIEASDLARRFVALPGDGVFVVGETGFGTGLNALLTAECFARHAPATAHLHFYSAELHPLPREDLARGLSHWPELEPYGRRLLEAWPLPAPGFHRIRLSDRIEFTLMFGDAATLWHAGPHGVDAWFLDGFAPSRNPDLWTNGLFETMAARSRPGTSVATFTAAGAVRRGLSAAGFAVERRQGFGDKRHRLSGGIPGRWKPQRLKRGRAVVVGAGFAGCATARALAERGWHVHVVDPMLARPAPPELAAVLYATASHHLNAQNRFYLGALLHAQRWLEDLGFPRNASEGHLDGVIQHLVDGRVAEKTRQAMDTGTWPQELLSSEGGNRVRIEGAGCLRPSHWCRFLLDHPDITATADRVGSISGGKSAVLELESGDTLEADAAVLCTAGATSRFSGLGWLPLRLVRGQVTFCRATEASSRWREAHCHAGYVTPAFDGVHCVGATFDRQRQSPVIDPIDDERNLSELQRNVPSLWEDLGGSAIEVVGHHAGLRCQSGDWLPLVGPCPDPSSNPYTLDERIWLNIAHGSRGLTHTPLCADLIADRLSGHPAAIDTEVMASFAPERFIERWRRRDPDWRP